MLGQVISEEEKQNWAQTRPLHRTVCHRQCLTDPSPLSPSGSGRRATHGTIECRQLCHVSVVSNVSCVTRDIDPVYMSKKKYGFF